MGRLRRLYRMLIIKVDSLVFVEKLSEMALRERRNLIAVSFVGILMVCLRLSPSGIPGLGINFEGASANAPEWIVLWAILYFGVAFSVYAGVDLASARANVLDRTDAYEGSEGTDPDANGSAFEEEEENLAEQKAKQLKWTRRYLRARMIFEVVVPIVVGVGTMMLLVWSIRSEAEKGGASEAKVVQTDLQSPFQVEVLGASGGAEESVSAIREARNGNIRRVKVRRRVLYKEVDLKRYIDERIDR